MTEDTKQLETLSYSPDILKDDIKPVCGCCEALRGQSTAPLDIISRIDELIAKAIKEAVKLPESNYCLIAIETMKSRLLDNLHIIQKTTSELREAYK